MPFSSEQTLPNIKPTILALVKKSGFAGDIRIIPLPSGGNNRVYRIKTNGSSLLIKLYFRHAKDPRDRLGTEFSFISFAWTNGIHEVPRPLGFDKYNSLGLYAYMHGEKPVSGDVTSSFVEQAVNFWAALNREKYTPEADRMPKASEACFSLKEYVTSVDRRMRRLIAIEANDEIHQQAKRFIHQELRPAWLDSLERITNLISRYDLGLDDSIPRDKWCLSPSDFGFHNSILGNDGRLRFIDFEYAGWDDPAKMVCDFFCQPEVPVPIRYFPLFADTIVPEFYDSESFERRLNAVWPLTQIKWCCIMLNDFLPEGNNRRNYALNLDDPLRRKNMQLHKAKAYFQEHIISKAASGVEA
jgi:hypothetical protein